MARFKPLPAEQMSEAQRQAVRELERGPRGKFNPHGPNALLLRSPELMPRTQKVGEYLRYKISLPQRLKEFGIIVTARLWGAQVEWLEHQPLAAREGIDPAAIEDLRQGRRPRSLREDEAAVFDFITELHATRGVSDGTFERVAKPFGEQGVIDLIALTGYYTMLAMVLNVGQEPLPGGKAPPLDPLGPDAFAAARDTRHG
jgi:4-carboxymuconolactone decarboxylase